MQFHSCETQSGSIQLYIWPKALILCRWGRVYKPGHILLVVYLGCSSTQFLYSNGRSVSSSDRCDGNPDCTDGSDETDVVGLFRIGDENTYTVVIRAKCSF